MGPSLSVDPNKAAQFTQNRECPLSLENMTQAVTLMPCGHTYDERSIQRIPGFGSLEAPAPCEGNSTQITKVRMVNRINCPLCTTPVKHYYRNWALREVCQEIPALFGTDEEKKANIPNRKAVPAPKGTLQDRFTTLVSGIFACFISIAAVSFAVDTHHENQRLIGEIKNAQAQAEMMKGIAGLVIIVGFVSLFFSPKK